MAESKEELKSLSMKVKEDNEKYGLKFNIQETKIMVAGHITSWQIDMFCHKPNLLLPQIYIPHFHKELG